MEKNKLVTVLQVILLLLGISAFVKYLVTQNPHVIINGGLTIKQADVKHIDDLVEAVDEEIRKEEK